MTGIINTARVAFDSLPSLWLSDERVQSHLPAQHVLGFVNLIHYAMTLTATTGSEWVDGEFSPSTALKRVRGLTAEALDAMLAAELVTEIDDDRWVVDFITPQTTHEQLQASADANASRSVTQKANHFTRKQQLEQKAAKTEHERELDRERKRRQRDKQKAEGEDTSDEIPNADPWITDGGAWGGGPMPTEYELDKCADCGRLDDNSYPDWSYDTAGRFVCGECHPVRYPTMPKSQNYQPDCKGCKYHGDNCYVHGSSARARDFSEPVTVN